MVSYCEGLLLLFIFNLVCEGSFTRSFTTLKKASTISNHYGCILKGIVSPMPIQPTTKNEISCVHHVLATMFHLLLRSQVMHTYSSTLIERSDFVIIVSTNYNFSLQWKLKNSLHLRCCHYTCSYDCA